LALEAWQASHAQHLFGSANVRGLLAFGAGRDVETDSLAFLQGLEALALNCGKMREEILTAPVGGDEAEALGIVEPLDGTCCHVLNILKKSEKGTTPEAKLKTAG